MSRAGPQWSGPQTRLEFGMIRRLAWSFLWAVMANVSALGGGVYSIQAGSDSHDEMPGMDMSNSAPAVPHQEKTPAPDECRFPWAPGCGSPSLCVPVAMTISPCVVSTVISQREAPVAALVQAPASADRSPDHPPPRV